MCVQRSKAFGEVSLSGGLIVIRYYVLCFTHEKDEKAVKDFGIKL